MAIRQYTLTQNLSNNTQKTVSFSLPQVAGTYRLTGRLNTGKSIDMGNVIINNSVGKLNHKLSTTISGKGTNITFFDVPFGLYQPKLSSFTYGKDNSSNTYYGSVTVTNPNSVSVGGVVWFKTSNSDIISENGTFTLAPGKSKTIMFGDIYSEGILIRVHFTYSDQRIFTNEVFAQCTLGNYKGDFNFYGVEEETSTTTTTTTTTTDAASSVAQEYQAVDSDGNFTLWRKIDAE